jgi:hypothetical protein
LLGGLAAFVWGRRGGAVVGLCVLSHWFLDLPVHVADLPLWGDLHKVGFGLWDRPVLAFVLELGVVFAGVAVYAMYARSKKAIWIFAALMLSIQMTNFVMPPPEASAQFAIMALSSYLLFAAAAWFVETKWGQSAKA